MKLGFWLLSVTLFAALAPAQSDEAEVKRISEMARRCRAESVKFREAGGRPGDPGDPALQWSAAFWQYGKEHPGAPAGVQATANALSWLRHADQDKEVVTRARTLSLDYPGWDRAVDGLRQSARKNGDYSPFLEIARRLLQHSKDGKVRAAIQLELGRVYQDQGQPDQAITSFEAVAREAPKSPQAEDAELLLHEMRNLQVGQPLLAFEAKTIDGQRIALADFRGKVLLLNFWATW